MLTFCALNLGCKVNRVELDEMRAFLLAHGMGEAALEEADLILVNSCTVTAEAERKTRKAVNRALAQNPQAQVLVTGCSVEIGFEDAIAGRERVVAVRRGECQGALERLCTAWGLQEGPESALPFGEGFNSRVGIKIQDGCDHACTYCIVHVARGRSISKPASDAVAEAQAIFGAGAPEVLLTGINLGAYRSDGMGLAGLTERLLPLIPQDSDGSLLSRIRLSSIEPMDIDDRLVDLLAREEGKVARHLHLPLQSGSTKVLREMDRPYTAESFCSLIERIRGAVPQLSLTTDIIVGFPGETDADFAETIDVAKRCGFSKIHVFPYSMREGTPAAARSDQVPAEVKKERAAILRGLSDELRGIDREKRRGSTEYAAVQPDGAATTESYHGMQIPWSAQESRLIRVTL